MPRSELRAGTHHERRAVPGEARARESGVAAQVTWKGPQRRERPMASINTGKVVVGGLAAGLVANVIDFVVNTFVLANSWEAFAKAHNLDPAAFTSPSVAITWVL